MCPCAANLCAAATTQHPFLPCQPCENEAADALLGEWNKELGIELGELMIAPIYPADKQDRIFEDTSPPLRACDEHL